MEPTSAAVARPTASAARRANSETAQVRACLLMNRLHLRSATSANPEDVTTVRRLVNAAFSVYRDSGVNFTGIDQDDAATARRMSGAMVWVVWLSPESESSTPPTGTVDQAETPVATITLDVTAADTPPLAAARLPSDPAAPLIGRISQFAVVPSYKGRGLGSLLLDYAEAQARKHSASETRLLTADRFEPLMRFYANRGYRCVGQLRQPGKTYDSLILAKPL